MLNQLHIHYFVFIKDYLGIIKEKHNYVNIVLCTQISSNNLY